MLKGLLCFLSLGITVMATRLPEINEKVLHKARQMSKRSYPVENAKLWWTIQEGEYKIIPYVIYPDYKGMSNRSRKMVLDGIEDFNKYTCVQFRPRVPSEFSPFVIFKFVDSIDKYGTCGATTIGFQNHTGFSVVKINVHCKFNTVIHELFHVVGYAHEFERPDSDDHLMSRLTQYKEYTVKKAPGLDLTPFDHFSISNYESTINRHTNLPLANFIPRLSYYDIRSINERYQCEEAAEGLLYYGCDGSTLPTVVGSGHLTSNNSVYEMMEAVKLVCDEGYEAVGHDISYCEDQTFAPPTLECRKIICEDISVNCRELVEHDVCNSNSRQRNLCLRTCGYCETACWIPPLVKGPGHLGIMTEFYVENEEVHLKCEVGFAPNTADTATCKHSTWDVDEFQCVKLIPEKEDERCRNATKYDVECNEFHQDKLHAITCDPLDLDVGKGRLLPNKTSYQIGDVVQLVCDPDYEPSSSSTAQCSSSLWYKYINEEGAAFDHGKLECVERTCKDSSEHCKGIARNERCEHPHHIGLVRKKCRKSCKLCGSCKGMPIFDRDISSVSPMKMEYKEDETVEINCFHGYHAVHTSTSECRKGQFHPPRLVCVPDLSSCIGPPSIRDAINIGPMKRSYLNGEKSSFRCKINPDDDPNSLVMNALPRDDEPRHVTCNNGRFETFHCPLEVPCYLDREAVEEICGFYDKLPIARKPFYTREDGFIQIFCDSERMKFAKCVGITGKFFSDGVDYRHDFPIYKYTKHINEIIAVRKLAETSRSHIHTITEYVEETIEDEVEESANVDEEDAYDEGYASNFSSSGDYSANIASEEGSRWPTACLAEFLPWIFGDGKYEPMKALYRDYESVNFRCNHKSTVQVLVCIKGHFVPKQIGIVKDTPTWVACYEDDCMDLSADCDISMCLDEKLRPNCRQTCDICEPPPCEELAMNFGGEFQNNYGFGIRHGRSDVFECMEGHKNKTVTCTRGKLYPPLDASMCSNGAPSIWQNCEDAFEVCPLLKDECTDEYISNECKLTCSHPDCYLYDEEYYQYEDSYDG